MDVRTGLALNQIGFGLGLMGAPSLYGRGWVGRHAGDTRAEVLLRSVGARNVALGAGTLLALRAGEDARLWFWANALVELADTAVLGRARRLGGASMAAATAAVAVRCASCSPGGP